MLTLNAPINLLSYGYVSVNILRELSKQTDVALFTIGPVEFEPENREIVQKAYNNSKMWDYKSHCVKIFHQNLLGEQPIASKHIGFPIFELDNFNEVERHNLESQDGLLVCSEWARQITKKVNDNVYTVPLGVDNSIFHYVDLPFQREEIIFLNIGKWEKRKGHDILAEAFYTVFKDVDDVKLWMMPKNKFINEEKRLQWENYYRSNLGDKVVLLPPVQKHSQIAEIINQSDVGVYPHRSEGFGLPLLETLACGKDIIATDYSGPTEYLNNDNATLIPAENRENASDGVFFFNQGQWARLDESYFKGLCEALRAHYEKAKEDRKRINLNGLETARDFTWENTANKLLMGVDCI